MKTATARFSAILAPDSAGQLTFTSKGFEDLLAFLEDGEITFQHVAVQAGLYWANVSQRILLRNTIQGRGFLTPACLWAYIHMRGNPEDIVRSFPTPEMSLMQITLLKEIDPAVSAPFLIDTYLNRKDAQEELRVAARLCLLRILDAGVSPSVMESLKRRYPRLEVLNHWKTSRRSRNTAPTPSMNKIDFHQLLRSIQDVKELSSLTRTVYLLSSFFIPLTDKEWRSLWLSSSDQAFFEQLRAAGMVESVNGGHMLCSELSKRMTLNRFLFESYPFVKDTVHRNQAERMQEERKQRIRSSELDRQALEMLTEGIICLDKPGVLYYMNRSAERFLGENKELRERLFGAGSLEEALRKYSRDGALAAIRANVEAGGTDEIFGSRIFINTETRRFQVQLGAQIVIISDVTDQSLIDKEIGKMYRHELKAALDVIGIGLESAQALIAEKRLEDTEQCLIEIENKRKELFDMLEDKMDFIRLHSDSFKIRLDRINLNLVTDKCVANYTTVGGKRAVCVQSDHLATPAIYVAGEERYLEKAIDNILRNAVKFTAQGTEVTVCLRGDKKMAELTIEDNGPGIPQENLGKIFQLGFTTNGTGRGLYMAKRIVTAHGGRIAVSSKLGSGTTFTIRLPLAPED